MQTKLLLNPDQSYLKQALLEHPEWSNKTVALDPQGRHWVHPLHFLCNAVFEGIISEKQAFKSIKLMHSLGSDISWQPTEGKDSLLITAISLYCEEVALWLLSQNVDIQHRGTHLGTALHWAAWTGCTKVMPVLLQQATAADLERNDNEFNSSPLHWALNGLLQSQQDKQQDQLDTIKLLIQAGCDADAIDGTGNKALALVQQADDPELSEIFSLAY